MDKVKAVKNILAHHGTKGMKWGVRRSRSSGPAEVAVKAGSTVSGKATIKTKGGSGHPAHPDSIAARVIQQKLAKSGSHSLSNKEINQLVTRHNLEKQVSKVPKGSGTYAKAAKHIGNFLGSPHGQASLKVASASVKSDKIKKAAAVTAAVTQK